MKTVASLSTTVEALETKRALSRALMAGTMGMRAEGEKYLPREPAESMAAYKVRLARTFLFNGYRRTVSGMTDKVMCKPTVVDENVPARIVDMLDNIDNSGRSLDDFARDVLVDQIDEGVSYILTDMTPPVTNEDGQPVTLTQADQQRMNRRPWAVHIPAKSVLGWRSENISGQEVLTQFRFMETVTEPDGPYADATIKQVRVFSREGNRVWWETHREDDNTGDWVLYEEGPVTIGEIPIAPAYSNRTGFMAGAPILEDLAEVNLAHWQSQSDQRNILHVARVPILFGAGLGDQDGDVEIGAGRMYVSNEPDAKLTWVEHSGAAIESGRDDLKDLEFMMEVFGLELLIPKPGHESATGAAIDQDKANTPLGTIAQSLENALERTLHFIAMFTGDAEGGNLTVNKEFGISLRAQQDMTAILQAYQAGLISRETAIKELQRRNLFSDNLVVEEELERVEMNPENEDTNVF